MRPFLKTNHKLKELDSIQATLPNKAWVREYKLAEKKAGWYLSTIHNLARNPKTYNRLHKDLIVYWKSHYKNSHSKFALVEKLNKGHVNTWSFLEKLSAKKELDAYLTKSISYLYLRDLGLDLNQKQAQKKVDDTVRSLVSKIEKNSYTSTSSNQDLSILHPWLSKKEFQPAYYWLMLKISGLKTNFSENNNNQEGLRKLIKIVAGILVHHLVLTDNETKPDVNKLMEVVQLGYAYGLTYPFVDDLLDSNELLSESDKVLFTETLRQTLRTKKVANYPKFENDSEKLQKIYAELKWAFEFLLKNVQQSELFFSRASMFFESQAIDRERKLENAKHYTLEDLLTTVVIKSASSRLVSRDLISHEQDEHFDHRTFCFGIYNQFNDDIKDIDEDKADKNLTPYTWFLYHQDKPNYSDVENPYHYYWAVVYYLVYELYKNNPQIKALFFERSMNALQSVFSAKGKNEFERLCKVMLNTPNTDFNIDLLQRVSQPQQEVWFDKLISKEVSHWLSKKREQSNAFKNKYEKYKALIEKQLPVEAHKRFSNAQLQKVANYSLASGGKRIRAVMSSVLSIDQYGFSDEQQRGVNQLLEYMHSASLILDDLPSQDDADIRRGANASHIQFNSVAKAELGSVYLMMKAIEVQANITSHSPTAVLKSLSYAANVTQAVCEGQLLDIETSGKHIDQRCLEKICHFKTGLAIEAALVIPAILAQQDDLHIEQLKRLAKHMGMMFQIRDDLLDICGDDSETGKPTGRDEEKGRMNFVSVQGEKQAIAVMLTHYNNAQKILIDMPKIRGFFGELLDFIIYRIK